MPLDLTKPANCTCQFPDLIARNGCGHTPPCPVYAAWKVKWDAATLRKEPEAEAPSPTPGEVEELLYHVESALKAYRKSTGVDDEPILATLRAALPARGWSFDMDAAPLNVQVLLQMRLSYRPYADRDPDWQYDVGYRTDHNNGGFVHARAGNPVAWMPLPTPPNAEPGERSGE